MPVSAQKIEQAKKLFGVNDQDIQRIISSQVAPDSPMPQSEQSQGGDLMDRLLQSRALPVGGAVLGGGVGALAGPGTSIAGAGAGYAGGDILRKEIAGLKGTKGVKAGISTPNSSPGKAEESVKQTVKGTGESMLAQGVGEALGYGLKLLKPGSVSTFLAKANDLLAKKTGFNQIPTEVLETRFMNEVLPKAIRFTQGQGEDLIAAGEKLLENKVKPVRIFDAEELNFLRKNLNAIGEGAEGLKKSLLDGLAKIVREEQVKAAPATGVTLPLQKLAFSVPQALKSFWPTRVGLMGVDAARSFGSGLMSKFAKYGGGPLIGGMNNQK